MSKTTTNTMLTQSIAFVLGDHDPSVWPPVLVDATGGSAYKTRNSSKAIPRSNRAPFKPYRSMTNPHDARIVNVDVSFEPVAFRMPLKFGGRVVDSTDLINVAVTLEGRDGKTAVGHGSMPVGNVWAWPSQSVEPPAAEKAMKAFAEEASTAVIDEFGHPIEVMIATIDRYQSAADKVAADQSLPESLPKLAQLVATSPLDAAVHDAYGRLHDRSSFAVLSGVFMNKHLGHYLDDRFNGEFLDPYVTANPKPTMPLYHLVGALDPLTDADVGERPDDDLPVTLSEWIQADGLTHLKIKLAGDDLDWDVNRVLSTDRVAAETQAGRGCEQWFYSVDFNEKCASVDYVLEFLDRIQAEDTAAYDRIQYIEQPTSRDLHAASQSPMHEAAKRKPVVIDESLVDYEALLRAQELGYSGVALKACKGQTESLLAAAAAQKFGMFLCVQDLTCPGASFLHSASLAAHVKTVAAIEGNGRQYCPGPNAKWADKYPGMFKIDAGTTATSELDGVGLGIG